MSYRDHDKKTHELAAWLSTAWATFLPYKREGNWDKDDDRPYHWATIWNQNGWGIHISRTSYPASRANRLEISACIPQEWRNKGACYEKAPSITVLAAKDCEAIKRDIERRLIGEAQEWFSKARETYESLCDFEHKKRVAIKALARFGFTKVSHSDTLYGPFSSSFRVNSDASIDIKINLDLMRAKQVAGLLNSLPKEKPNEKS